MIDLVQWTEDENHVRIRGSLVKVSKYTDEDTRKLLFRYCVDDLMCVLPEALYIKYPEKQDWHDSLYDDTCNDEQNQVVCNFILEHTGLDICELDEDEDEDENYKDVEAVSYAHLTLPTNREV